MNDSTATKLRQSLAQPEATMAGRRAFVAIIWISALIALAAHAIEAETATPVALSAALVTALGIWLHGIFGIHSDAAADAPLRTVVMTGGAMVVFVALVAIDASYLVVLFGLYTLVFVWSQNDRVAIALSFAVTLCWIGGWLYHELPTGALATPVFVWATLVAIQTVQSRVASQSADRRALLEEVQRTRAELADAQRARGVLEERERVAAEIHDTLAQGFTSIVLLSEATQARLDSLPDAQIAESLALVQQTARENLTAARRLVEASVPAELDAGSLEAALHQAGRRFEARAGVKCDVIVDPAVPAVCDDAAVALLRVAQESLANAAKYAEATRVTIELATDDHEVRLIVRDDGRGFDSQDDPTEVAGGVGGQGLRLMRERVKALGGSWSIASILGEGTTVTVHLRSDTVDGLSALAPTAVTVARNEYSPTSRRRSPRGASRTQDGLGDRSDA